MQQPIKNLENKTPTEAVFNTITGCSWKKALVHARQRRQTNEQRIQENLKKFAR